MTILFRCKINQMCQAAMSASAAQETIDSEFGRGRVAAFEAVHTALCVGDTYGNDVIPQAQVLSVLAGLLLLTVTGNGGNFERKRGCVTGYAALWIMCGGSLPELTARSGQMHDAGALLAGTGQRSIAG